MRHNIRLRRELRVLIPVRGLGGGKSRLSAVLDRGQRWRLNRALLERTLGVVIRWLGEPARCIVVSPCPAALRIARGYGATAWREPAPHRNLNRAIVQAVRQCAKHGAHRVAVLACDLPKLSASGLESLVAALDHGAEIVIAPDVDGSGTNALLLGTHRRFPFGYGAGSRERHFKAARANGWRAALCAHPALACDLDTPQALARYALGSNMRNPGERARARSGGRTGQRSIKYPLAHRGRATTSASA